MPENRGKPNTGVRMQMEDRQTVLASASVYNFCEMQQEDIHNGNFNTAVAMPFFPRRPECNQRGRWKLLVEAGLEFFVRIRAMPEVLGDKAPHVCVVQAPI
ncbi:MAG: hypothetical protein ACLRMZ_00355 [Blautia marasmi]